MPVLTYAQMEGYALKAGWTPAEAPVVAAIGEAESGGNTDAVNPTDNHGRQSSYGWLQISNGTHTPPSPNWADPATNAALGRQKFVDAGHSFSPWGTYDSGAYRAYLSGSTTPDTNVKGNPNALTAETTAAISADCLLGISGVPGTSWINDLFGSGGNVGQMCFVTRSNARGYIGALILAAGTVGFALSLALMTYIAGQDTRAGRQAQQLAVRFAAPEAAAASAASSPSAAASSPPRRPAPQGRHAPGSPRNQFAGRHAAPGEPDT